MVLGRVKVRHVIELSRESGAVALLFCILFRRTVCRYILREISRFKLCASTIVHLTVAAAATTTATLMVLNGNISRARVERANAVIGRGERERERECEQKGERDGHTTTDGLAPRVPVRFSLSVSSRQLHKSVLSTGPRSVVYYIIF